MKLERPITLKELADLLECKFVGDAKHKITGINEIHMVEEGDLVFVDHPKYYDKALNSAATTILIDKETDCPKGKGLLVCDDPFAAYNKLAVLFSPFYPWTRNNNTAKGISPYAVIQPNVTIGRNVTIGKNTWIHSGVVIYDNCHIGDNVVIHANSVIGADAFYFQKKEYGFRKMHTCGRVIINDNVEIGASCTIDRGVSGDTIIGEDSKLDNQVHVGHDVQIGKRCLFAAHVGIAGCVTIEDDVTLWGQVGVVSDVTIGKGAVVYGQSGVGKDLEGGKKYLGSPCDDARTAFVEISSVKKLPGIIKKHNL